MNRVTPMHRKPKLSYHEYNERYAGSKKNNKRKRGKERFTEQTDY